MNLDVGNALAAVAEPGVPRDALERLDDRVAAAHERIERGVANGEFGYASLNLPETADTAAVETAADRIGDVDHVILVGIGGSALGAATLADALAGPDAAELHVLDNVDPAAVERTLDRIDLASAAVNVVSQSGTTAETLANFLVVRDAMADAGVDWTDRTVVTTGDAGNLRDLADAHDLPSVSVPDGVPGRFSVLSTVGLLPAALLGVDTDGLLAGASAAREKLGPSLFDSPAYAYGALAYALDVRGASMDVMMPYAEGLETFAEWFAQLWAESLGKDGLGQTPVRALGATDQHSQLQLYRAGPHDKLVTFVGVDDRPDVPIPSADLEGLDYLSGASLGGLLDAELDATEASLAAAGVPNLRVQLDAVDAESVGELLFSMEAACVLAGELYGVETFDQPAVEWGKEAARGLLRGDRTLDEGDSLEVE